MCEAKLRKFFSLRNDHAVAGRINAAAVAALRRKKSCAVSTLTLGYAVSFALKYLCLCDRKLDTSKRITINAKEARKACSKRVRWI